MLFVLGNASKGVHDIVVRFPSLSWMNGQSSLETALTGTGEPLTF